MSTTVSLTYVSNKVRWYLPPARGVGIARTQKYREGRRKRGIIVRPNYSAIDSTACDATTRCAGSRCRWGREGIAAGRKRKTAELGTEISTPGPSVRPSVCPSASVTSSCVLQQGQMLSPRKRTSRREEKKRNLGKGKAWESFRGFRDRGCDRANRAIPIYAFLFNSPNRTEGA